VSCGPHASSPLDSLTPLGTRPVPRGVVVGASLSSCVITLVASILIAAATISPAIDEPALDEPEAASPEAAQREASPPVADAEPLVPRRMYAPLHRSALIDVAPGRAGELSLVLMHHDGTEIVRVDGIRAGAVDLAASVPEIWTLERSAWLQALDGDEPFGAPLVIQPLRDRPVLRTTSSVRPDGETRYTRIVGWAQTPLNPSSEADAALAEAWKAEATLAGTAERDRPMSGVRLFVDRDVVLETVYGDIRVALRYDEAPNTAWNFRELAEGGLYDGTIFHRIVPLDRSGHPFVIQGGDPSRTGSGGPGRSLPMEPSRLEHDFGVISMARADDPDSAGSQFFICLSREGTARLDGQYCAFGEVIAGTGAVIAISESELADPATGRPFDPPLVLRATLVPAPPRAVGVGRPDRRIERPQPRDRERTPSGHDAR